MPFVHSSDIVAMDNIVVIKRIISRNDGISEDEDHKKWVAAWSIGLLQVKLQECKAGNDLLYFHRREQLFLYTEKSQSLKISKSIQLLKKKILISLLFLSCVSSTLRLLFSAFEG